MDITAAGGSEPLIGGGATANKNKRTQRAYYILLAVAVALGVVAVAWVAPSQVANAPTTTATAQPAPEAAPSNRASREGARPRKDAKDDGPLGPIKHIVVLMLENRSFDHMVGMMKQWYPEVEGCLPIENHCYNRDKSGSKVYVAKGAEYYPDREGPDHSCPGTLGQIFGDEPHDTPVPPMTGFLKSYEHVTPGNGTTIMNCFSYEQVPAISTLAKDFALLNGWFSGLPGPTLVNRMFALSGTSQGRTSHHKVEIAEGYNQTTIFETLDKHNATWRVYFEDVPAALIHSYPRKKENWKKMRPFGEFYVDALRGKLPSFSWLEPRYFDGRFFNANDQHPGHDVALGDHLIANVYNALRNGRAWKDTVLLITYDEHGGFFDHVSPPKAPSPDGKTDPRVPFDFTRVGVRVPAIVVSPRIKRGVVPRPSPDSPQFDHSSIVATVRKVFAPNAPPLTKRDAWSRTFDFLWEDATDIRSDCPRSIPYVTPHRKAPGSPLPIGAEIGSNPISDFQEDLVDMAYALGRKIAGKAGSPPPNQMTEREASDYCISRIKAFLRRLFAPTSDAN